MQHYLSLLFFVTLCKEFEQNSPFNIDHLKLYCIFCLTNFSILSNHTLSTTLDKCKVAQDCLDRDRRETEALAAVVQELMKYLESLDKLKDKIEQIEKLEIASIVLDSTSLAANSVSTAVEVVKSVKALQLVQKLTAVEIQLLKECPKMIKSLEIVKGTALVAGKLATFLAVAGLGISIFEIVKTSIDIHNGSETEAAKRFKENARNLEKQKMTLCEIEDRLRGESQRL